MENIFYVRGAGQNSYGCRFGNNGTIDAADYVVWRKTGGLPDGYNEWRTNFGRTFFAGSGAGGNGNAAVPEPTTFVMLIVATVGIRLRRRQIA